MFLQTSLTIISRSGFFSGRTLVTIVLVVGLLGCAQVLVPDSATLPTTDATTEAYRIQPGDKIEMKFFYNPELNESVTVRPDGRVSLQLAHEVVAAGLTPAMFTRKLIEAYEREIENPEITVIMRSFAGNKVFVDGEVNSPALMPLLAGMTVLQSISAAGGLKDTARTNEIIIIRKGQAGKPLTFTVDMEGIIDGTAREQDIALMPFDVVYVPKSAIANVNKWVDQYIRRNIPVNVGYYWNLSD